MIKRPLLITEHYIITVSRTDKTVLGQIRHRQDVIQHEVDFWEATTRAGVWTGPYASREEVEAIIRKGV